MTNSSDEKKSQASRHDPLKIVPLRGSTTRASRALRITLVAMIVFGVSWRMANPNDIAKDAHLYATPWATFRQVTLPQIFPAILAGFLLSFTFSFDDFIIAFFVAGSESTLPIYVFSSIRRGVTPEINAIGTMVLAVSLTLLIAAQFLLRARARQARPAGS